MKLAVRRNTAAERLSSLMCQSLEESQVGTGSSPRDFPIYSKRTPEICCANTDTSLRVIEPFQIGETPTFISHIKAGLDALASDNARILVFSGGDTKRSKISLSEATSYRNLALTNDLFGHPPSLASRIFTDDNATDSFQNVLFPIVAFALNAAKCTKIEEARDQDARETHKFPKHLTVVGHEFKRKRFEELHLTAIRWPKDSAWFEYVGIDPPMDVRKRLEVLNGEMLRGYGAWQKDLYGSRELLASKRLARGWSAHKKRELENTVTRGWQYSPRKDDILALISWDGGASGQDLYNGRLPWDDLDSQSSEILSNEEANLHAKNKD
jgi:hypothetical protein